MSTEIPTAARPVLVWMSENRGRLADLVTEEIGADGDASPEADGSIRAHLRFVAEGLGATAGSDEPGLADYAAAVDTHLDRDRFAEYAAETGEAHAFVATSQFGEDAGEDPVNREVIDRRVRINAWIRLFLDTLDEARSPAEPWAPGVNAWMHQEQDRLANTIFAMDRRAKQVEIDRGNTQAIDDQETANLIGRAAVIQAHMRFLVEAIGTVRAA